MRKAKILGKRETRLVEIVRLYENVDNTPPTAVELGKKYNVTAQVIRADLRFLRDEGYLPSARLAELKRRYKPKFIKGGGVM